MNQVKELTVNILSAAVGTGKEAALAGVFATAGVMLSEWLGGWDKSLELLLTLILIDYVTGVLGAIKHKKLNSDIMYWGGVRKSVVLLVIGLAVLLDDLIGSGTPVFRTAAVYFYAGREGLSVVENLGLLGVPLPPKIKEMLTQLQGDDTDGNNKSATDGK